MQCEVSKNSLKPWTAYPWDHLNGTVSFRCRWWVFHDSYMYQFKTRNITWQRSNVCTFSVCCKPVTMFAVFFYTPFISQCAKAAVGINDGQISKNNLHVSRKANSNLHIRDSRYYHLCGTKNLVLRQHPPTSKRLNFLTTQSNEGNYFPKENSSNIYLIPNHSTEVLSRDYLLHLVEIFLTFDQY